MSKCPTPMDCMDLRDYFAAKAMPTIMKNWYDDDLPPGDEDNAFFIASLSYRMADAMIETREKENAKK